MQAKLTKPLEVRNQLRSVFKYFIRCVSKLIYYKFVRNKHLRMYIHPLYHIVDVCTSVSVCFEHTYNI